MAYTRISTLAGALDDKAGLLDWSAARAVIGTIKQDLEAKRRDCDGAIYSQVAHLISAHEDPWGVPSAKKPLKELIRKAQELGGSEDASGLGTAFHGLCETLDGGNRPAYIPRQLEPWLDAYEEAMQDWESVLVEPFVVCDKVQSAGSPDRYLRHRETGEMFCADIKSGTSEPDYPLKVTIQVAIGAHAELYDQPSGKREEIPASLERGLLIHAPIRESRPRVNLYWLDLTRGWELAEMAVKVRDARKMPKLEKIA